MRSLRELLIRFSGLFGRRRRERELADELESHLQFHIEDNLRAGMPPLEARRQALIKLGGVEPTKELYRDQRSLPVLERFLQDLRYTSRLLRKSPGFAAVAIITLAVGIGSSTGVFAIANAVLLRQMPYPESERIVVLWGADEPGPDPRGQVSFTDIEDVRRRSRVFSAVTNFADWTPTLSGEGEPERLAATQVSDGFFSVVCVSPMLGRPFTPEEQIEGKDRVVILSYQLWQRRFGGDPNIIGRTLRLSSNPHEVVGVMPANFEALPSTLVQGGELYRPVAEAYDDTQRSSQHLRALARLKPGVTLQQAQADVDRISRELQKEHPTEDAGLQYRIAPLHEDATHELRPSLLMLLGAVFMLLLVACANVAGLLLARGSARQREIAIRAAVGASSSRLFTQTLVESLVLATAGGTLGLLLAWWARDLARALAPKLGSPLAHASLDPAVLAFAVGTVVITAVLFGVAPALQTLRIDLADSLKQGGHSGDVSRSHKRLHGGIIAGEMALALVLLTIGGLLIRSFVRLQNVDIGFEPEDRIVMNVWLPWAVYKQPERQITFYSELMRRVESIAGVKSAALVQNPPLGNFDGRGILPEGRQNTPENLVSPQAYVVTPRYLRTMGIPVLRGRDFDEADNENGAPVAMVSESLARQLWPGQEALGKRFQLFSDEKVDGKYIFRTVVGVVGDIRHNGPEQPVKTGFYIPHRQLPMSFMTLIVHSSRPKALVPLIRREVAALDSEIALFRIGNYEEFLGQTMLVRRIAMLLIVAFGSLALFQAAVGLYGLISYLVARREREFGVRAALGARPADLLRVVVGSAFRLILTGSIAGIFISLAASRAVASMLFGTAPGDLPTLITAVLVLAAVGMLASYLPARHAARTDPMTALRSD